MGILCKFFRQKTPYISKAFENNNEKNVYQLRTVTARHQACHPALADIGHFGAIICQFLEAL
ncbi:MAG: hypothetical protein RQ714_07455 [Nitrosomonas sp.]|nr:hypothetical protein [Nitrosomonas sp.]